MLDPTAVASATVIVLVAIGGLAKVVITALNDAKKEILTLNSDLAKAATAQGEKIHDLVNGNAHEAAKKLAEVESQVALLREEIKRLQEQRVEEAKQRPAVGQVG